MADTMARARVCDCVAKDRVGECRLLLLSRRVNVGYYTQSDTYRRYYALVRKHFRQLVIGVAFVASI